MIRNGHIVKKREGGQAAFEFSLLVPILFTVFLALVQLVIYLQSSIATQYAAFVAARSYQVYGVRTLGDIGYPRLRGAPYTEGRQTTAEAAAEKVVMESLLWESRNILVDGGMMSLNRFYKDGIDFSRNGVSSDTSQGRVRLNVQTGLGAEVTYCMPIFAPGIRSLFALAKKEYPCTSSRDGGYTGVAVVRKAQFGVEPEVAP